MKRPGYFLLRTILGSVLGGAFILAGCKKTSDLVIPPPGPAWITFTETTTPQLLDDKINSLNADQSGRVWIGTDSGANYFQRGTWGRIRDSLRYSPDGVQSRYKVNYIHIT